MTKNEIIHKINLKKKTLEDYKIQLDNVQSEDEEGEIEMWIRHKNREIKELEAADKILAGSFIKVDELIDEIDEIEEGGDE